MDKGSAAVGGEGGASALGHGADPSTSLPLRQSSGVNASAFGSGISGSPTGVGGTLPNAPTGGGGHASPSTATGGAGTQGSLSTVALEAIEQRYVEILRALSAEPQLEPFRNEYEKLHRLLHSSLDGEQRLLRQERELRDELETHQQQITTAMQLSQEDEEAITSLRTEIEAAWAKADAAHEQEQRSRELVHALRQQVTELDAMVEKTARLSMGQEAYLRDLLTLKRDREEEAVLLHATLNRTEAEHRQISAQLSEAEQLHSTAQNELETQRLSYQQFLTDLEMEQRERTAKEASVRQYRDATERCMRQLEECNAEVERAMKAEKKGIKDVDSTTQEMQLIARQLVERQERFAAEANRLATAERENTLLKHDLPQRQAFLREHEDALRKAERKLRALEKSARAQQTELAALVEKRTAAAAEAQARAAAVEVAITELSAAEKECAVLEEAVVKAMQRKTNTVHGNTVKATARSQVEGQRVMEAGKSRRLDQQLELLRTENEQMRKSIYYAEQHHEKQTKEAQQALLTYHRTLDSIRTRRSEVKGVEEDIALHQKKLKAQQELLNTVMADRLRTEKVLHETDAELQQLRSRHSSSQEELEVVKTELIQQEADLCRLHGLRRQLNKDIANTEQRLRFLREDQKHAESRVEALRGEAQQLRQVITKCDQESQQQNARFVVMKHERNAIATQLLLRSEELELLREKSRLSDTARAAGARKYDRVMEQLAASRDALTEQRLRCRLALVRLRYLDRLHGKEQQQEKLLAQSCARVRALADELGTKHNVHCWRNMEGNVPEVIDALAKVQLLQAKLQRKRDELKAKTDLVEEEEKTYQQLRQKLARLPGPEAAEELVLCAENMTQRKAQLAEMTDSLATAEAEAEALEVHVGELQEELQDIKNRYFQERTKHTALCRGEKLAARTWGPGVGGARRGVGVSGSDAGAAAATAVGTSPSAESMMARASSTSPSRIQVGEGPLLRSGTGGSRQASGSRGPDEEGTAATSRMNSSAAQSRTARQHPRRVAPGGSQLAATLTAGPPLPEFPLQKPPNQRQFVGGGFSLTR